MQSDNEILNTICNGYNNKNRVWVPLFKFKCYSVPVIALHSATLGVLQNSNYISTRKTRDFAKDFAKDYAKRFAKDNAKRFAKYFANPRQTSWSSTT